MIEVYLLNLTDRLEKPVKKFLYLFTQSRREKILSYKFTADRNRTLWAELLVRSVIAKKISRPIEEILIEREDSGKPYVVDSNLKISLAHSEHWAACSVGEVASGIDIEENSSDALAIAENFFTGREYQQLRNLDGHARAKKFLCLWTIKESFAKFSGRNLQDTLAVDSKEILFGHNQITGRNFFTQEAVVGVCTQRGHLPKNFTLFDQNSFPLQP